MASYTKKASTDNSVQIVLIGNSGSGKSCSGNTILNKKLFPYIASPKSVTKCSQVETQAINGWTITVVDTPGRDCTEISQQEVVREIRQVLQNLQGPYSFLLVLHVGLVEVDEINKIYALRNVLGPSYLEHTIILFSHTDDLEFKTFKEFLKEGGNELQTLLKDVDNRCHSWNNKGKRCDEDVEKLLRDLKKTEIRSSMNRSQHAINKNKPKIPSEKAGNSAQRVREQESALMCQNTITVLFLGMTKVGKSSRIKTLQRRGQQTENKDVYTYSDFMPSLHLIDSPDFDENPVEIQKIISQSLSTFGPHVIVIVMTVDRFSPATKRIMQQVEKCLEHYSATNTMILFTRKDDLEEKTLRSFIQENSDLRELVSRNGGRVYALNNRDGSDQRQVDELLQMIAGMIRRQASSSNA